jgi:hypothetical protein
MENRESSHPTGFLPLALFKGKGGRGDRDLEPPISIILILFILPILLKSKAGSLWDDKSKAGSLWDDKWQAGSLWDDKWKAGSFPYYRKRAGPKPRLGEREM